MTYQHLTAKERISIAALRRCRWSRPEMARELGRDPSTIWRETKRNASYDDSYRSARAPEKAIARRGRSPRNSHFGRNEFARVEELLREKWSPQQISERLRRGGELSISHETIYRHVSAHLAQSRLPAHPSASGSQAAPKTLPQL